jgi:hypothetical protein
MSNEYDDFNDQLKKKQGDYTDELLKLYKKAETEQQALEREDSFHFAKTKRRDIVVHCAVTILPRVNGKTLIGEKQVELPQLCFEIPAKSIPMRSALWQQPFRELMTLAFQQLMKIGAVRE